MRILSHLFENNKKWAEDIKAREPDFFMQLSNQQSPEYLWIGCADSRVPASQIVGLMPGNLFVHRNVANVVVHTDLNCLSTIQYAVDTLKVKHIIVCGHYGCGGVKAALLDQRYGLIDNWLRHIQDVRQKYETQIRSIAEESKKWDRLCELNVIEQVLNVCETTIVQDAWARGQELAVHGWIYGVQNGLLHDLHMCITSPAEIRSEFQNALSSLDAHG